MIAGLIPQAQLPLANRLGLGLLKWELEDMAFRYLEPEAYRRIAAALSERRADREEWIATMRARLTAELRAAGVAAEVQGRAKHLYSIWRKMQKKSLAFEQLYDVRAVRILVDDVPACYAALGVVHGAMPNIPSEFDDYIATPKSNGYRSIHTAVIGPGGKTLEVQIRTREMHETSEHGVAAHWRYKEGAAREAGYDERLSALRDLLAPRAPGEGDFLDQLGGQLFADYVYALSPRGDVVELPGGATPLDFAYRIHSEVGNHCQGVRINDRLCPLATPLQNGDFVQIVTAKAAHPSLDWLNFVATPTARNRIRQWYKKSHREENILRGTAMLEREYGLLIERLGVPVRAADTVPIAGTVYAPIRRAALREAVIATPRLGSINIHCGKAPEYRGSAPAF